MNYEPYSFITLTPKGAEIATEITRRHRVIKNFLLNVLQLDAEKAEANACRMEHAMEKTVIDRLVQFIEYVNNCPRTGPDWIEYFVRYCSTDKHVARCEDCIDQCKADHRKML